MPRYAPVVYAGAAPGALYQTVPGGLLAPIAREDGSAPQVGDVVTRMADLHGAGLDGWVAAPGMSGSAQEFVTANVSGDAQLVSVGGSPVYVII